MQARPRENHHESLLEASRTRPGDCKELDGVRPNDDVRVRVCVRVELRRSAGLREAVVNGPQRQGRRGHDRDACHCVLVLVDRLRPALEENGVPSQNREREVLRGVGQDRRGPSHRHSARRETVEDPLRPEPLHRLGGEIRRLGDREKGLPRLLRRCEAVDVIEQDARLSQVRLGVDVARTDDSLGGKRGVPDRETLATSEEVSFPELLKLEAGQVAEGARRRERGSHALSPAHRRTRARRSRRNEGGRIPLDLRQGE